MIFAFYEGIGVVKLPTQARSQPLANRAFTRTRKTDYEDFIHKKKKPIALKYNRFC